MESKPSKETAPWMREAAFDIWSELIATEGEIAFTSPKIVAIAQIIAKHAEECTAPAPQPEWKKEALALVVLLRAKCSDEEWANMESRFECRAPAPQLGRCPLCGSNKANLVLGKCAEYRSKREPAHLFHWESTSDDLRANMYGVPPVDNEGTSERKEKP